MYVVYKGSGKSFDERLSDGLFLLKGKKLLNESLETYNDSEENCFFLFALLALIYSLRYKNSHSAYFSLLLCLLSCFPSRIWKSRSWWWAGNWRSVILTRFHSKSLKYIQQFTLQYKPACTLNFASFFI